MKKIAIIGASYLQEPLIQKAKQMGIETHVFAWAADDVGEKSADYFYPISIVEKELILVQCRKIGIDGICSIASDLAAVTVNYVADAMRLVGNTLSCTQLSTNKHCMRKRFEACGDPSPKSILVSSVKELGEIDLNYPVIVKPTDRSGSRGIMKLETFEGLEAAIEYAKVQGFEKQALVEEFVTGQEYSVEYISQNGKHHFLAVTKKYTTGAPHFIETAHLEPAFLAEAMLEKIKSVVSHALDSLEIKNSASHTEIKISESGQIAIIEIGGRMGGDCIGSSLVELSTGVDFLKAVIQVSLGEKVNIKKQYTKAAAIRFVLSEKDIEVLNRVKKAHPEYLVEAHYENVGKNMVTDSSTRFGYFLMKASKAEELEPYLPEQVQD